VAVVILLVVLVVLVVVLVVSSVVLGVTLVALASSPKSGARHIGESEAPQQEHQQQQQLQQLQELEPVPAQNIDKFFAKLICKIRHCKVTNPNLQAISSLSRPSLQSAGTCDL
jgi:flagellar basal body-associated protein FliL